MTIKSDLIIVLSSCAPQVNAKCNAIQAPSQKTVNKKNKIFCIIGLDEASLGYLSIKCIAENVKRRNEEDISLGSQAWDNTSSSLSLHFGIVRLSACYYLAAFGGVTEHPLPRHPATPPPRNTVFEDLC